MTFTRTHRRLALLGVVLSTQLLAACCLPPIWHGGHRHGHRFDSAPVHGGQVIPLPRPPGH